uniref:Uncharacterized protein n=1 Tax=Romanomermis culicivorax TaxID=13658 RepID=A0A915K1L7_ROMCU
MSSSKTGTNATGQLGMEYKIVGIMGIRAFLQRSEVIAEFTGDVLTVWPCKQINVSKISYEYKKVQYLGYKNSAKA